jgi:hypothetical protein
MRFCRYNTCHQQVDDFLRSRNVREGVFISQGFAELEYGILRWMGAVDDSTLVVTTGSTVLLKNIECYLRH